MSKVRFAATALSGVMMALLLTAQIAVAAPVAGGPKAEGAATPAAPFVCSGTWFFASAGIGTDFAQGDSHAGGTFTFIEGAPDGEMRVRMTADGFVVGRFRFGDNPADPNDEATIDFATPIHISGILWHGNGPTPPETGWSFNGVPGPITGNTGLITPVSLTATTIAMIAAGGESGGIDFCFGPEPPPVLEVIKTADDTDVTAGDTIGFSITVTNTGGTTATNVTLNDPLPAGSGSGVTWAIGGGVPDGGTNAADCDVTANLLTCAFGDLAPGASVDVHVTATTSATECTTYDNTATASADNASDATDDATIACDQPQNPLINIKKYTRVDVPPVTGGVCPTLGKPVSMTFVYTGQNLGPGLPYEDQSGKVTFTGDPNGAPVTITNSGLIFTPSTVAAGEQFTISGTFKAQSTILLTFAGGTSTISFHTSCSQPIRLGDQYGSIKLVAYNGTLGSGQLPPAPSDLGDDADVPTGPTATVGDTVVWNYVVTNPGTLPLENVVVTDNNGTPGNPGDDFNPTPVLGPDNVHNVGDTNTDGLLDPGEEWRYTASGTAALGQYANIGEATGTANATNVSDTDPSHYLGVFPTGDVCKTLGKPKSLTFMYTGDQFPSSHSQGSKVKVTGTTGNASPVSVVVKDPALQTSVALNGTFTITGNKFKADTKVEIRSSTGVKLQTITFHTSCSQPIHFGDQYGSLQLVDYVGDGKPKK